MNPRLSERAGFVWLNVIALVVITALEVLFYPYIAESVHGLAGGTRGADSSIGYFRDVYVAAGAVLYILTLIASVWAASRTRRFVPHILIGAWIVNVALVIGSALWYFNAVRTASEYRG
jgi:hypothetical protein